MSIAETHSATEVGVLPGDGEVADYWELLKPRVMSLVIFTALVGLVVAPGGLHPVVAFTALLCIGVGAGASGALNMWYDADIDAVMERTSERPIPAGKVSMDAALSLGVVLSILSVGVLGLVTNWMAAGLLAFTIVFYVGIYTIWLKRWTPQNIVIGGAAGAFPPIIGWVAATNSFAIEPIILFAIIFLWTPPHFWALALLKSDEYARANVPMLPVVSGDQETRKQIIIYSALTAIVAMLPVAMGFAGFLYGIVTGILGVAFIWFSVRLYKTDTKETSRRACLDLFAFSILYLFAIFSALLVEKGLQI